MTAHVAGLTEQELEVARSAEFDLVLSGYFFLREWLDHGHPSHGLHKLGEEKEAIEAERRATLESVSDAVSEFHDTAEDLIFTLQQAPRWDSHIVETYHETIRYYRHLITLEQPEYEEFISWARVPYLGSKDTKDASDYPLDPVSEEHRSLEEDGPMGREWLLRTAAEALAGIEDEGEDESADGQKAAPEANWLVTKSPDLLLAAYLRRYFDLDVEYKRPAGLDLPPDDEPDEPMAEAPKRGDDDDTSGGGEEPGSDKRLQVVTSDEDDEAESDHQPSQGGGDALTSSATRPGQLRWLGLLLTPLAVLSACSGGGAGDSSASGGSGRSSTGGDTETLPTSGGGEDLKLPTVPGGASDTVNISTTTSTTTTTTTTTTIPTTTTTVPPPVIPSDVLFDTGQATLKPEATPYLQDLADQINQRHPGARLHFVGHTDSRGSVEANNTRFAGHGFDRGRLTAEGAGESRLLVADTDGSGIFSDAAGRQNRRVEIRIR